MSPRARLFVAASASIALLIAVVMIARDRSAPPARCAAGMIAAGPRCCGEGQHLEGDRCAGPPARCAAGLEPRAAGCVALPRVLRIEGGLLHVGPGDWEAQGVVTPYDARLQPFGLDAFEVTEDRWLACVAARACPPIPLTGEPGRAAAGMTLDEADAFCRWAGGALPTADQLAFAAAGRAGRRYAWGDTGAVCRRAAWGLAAGPCAWGARAPEIAGSHPDGTSPEGARDLAGNVAEWARGHDGSTEVRGGSFLDDAASSLRAWQHRVIPPTSRAPDIGLRCAYPAP